MCVAGTYFGSASVRLRQRVLGKRVLHLSNKFMDRTGILAGSERRHSTGDEHRDRSQELSELARCSRIETAMGAFGHVGDRPKHLPDLAVVSFLEHEASHT